jgi:hypothetical protein
MIYVYQTPEFVKAVQNLDAAELVKRQVLRVEEDENAICLFEPAGPYLIRKSGRFRMIGQKVQVRDVHVLCMLSMMAKPTGDYDEFIRYPASVGPRRWSGNLNHDSLAGFVQQREREGVLPIQHDPLPSQLHAWLQSPSWHIHHQDAGDDIWIYESELWVDAFHGVASVWQSFYHLVFQAQDEAETLSRLSEGHAESRAETDANGRQILFHNRMRCSQAESRTETDANGRSIEYTLFQFPGTPKRRVLFLIAPHLQPANQIDTGDAKLKALRQELANVKSYDTLQRLAVRAYPAWMLGEDTHWKRIEDSSDQNLVLSPEEEQLLYTAGLVAQPLFINGRAGSGKSLMLHYLFADYCYRRIKAKDSDLVGVPLFLTYSKRLRDESSETVTSLIRMHARFIEDGAVNSDQLDSIDAWFREFRSFLVALLPDERQSDFDETKFVDYRKFKQLYTGRSVANTELQYSCKLPAKRRVSPELAWHTIRAFIKGRQLESFLTPDDYAELPRKERAVSFEEFQQIHDEIWLRWYAQLSEHGLWDDQDLVREVLAQEKLPQEYPVIFCDEAQDFTRLEYDLLMRMSPLTRFDLPAMP